MIKALVWSVVALGGLYLVAVGWLFLAQRRMIYPAPAVRMLRPADGYTDVLLHTADGLALKAAYRAGRAGQPTLIFFHGNGDNLEGARTACRMLEPSGVGLLLVEYRGYGDNPGSPSEQGLYLDGRAALDWLMQRGIEERRIVLIGTSLGSGVATQLAVERPVGGLVLISAFTSLPDVAAQHLRYVPARLLVRDRYDNLSKMGAVQTDHVLVLHGWDDVLIPADHGEALARAKPGSTFTLVPGTGHELAYLPQAQATVASWLARLPER